MYVLDKLWQGKLSPSEQCINADSEYSEIRHKAVQLENADPQVHSHTRGSRFRLVARCVSRYFPSGFFSQTWTTK